LPEDNGKIYSIVNIHTAAYRDKYILVNNGKYIDAWNRELRYIINKYIIKIYSVGPNGIEENGTNDDIKVFTRP
jgi:hypothetical protein